jgi:uncharacterized protein (TIGR02145 family)
MKYDSGISGALSGKIHNILLLVVSALLFTSCEKPERVVKLTTLDAVTEDISYTSATLKGEITDIGLESIEDHGIMISENAGMLNSTPKGLGAASAKSTYQVLFTDLKRSTVYYFKAYASVESKTILAENVKQFRTLDSEIPVLTTRLVTNIKTTEATSGGTITITGGETISKKGLAWAKNAGVNLINALDTTVSLATGNSWVTPITGLEPGHNYYVRAYAINSKGTGYGNELSFPTAGITEVVTLDATAITNNTAILNGTVSANNLPTVVTFEYGQTTSYGQSVTVAQSPVSGNTVTNISEPITGLSLGTTYHFRLKAINTSGTAYGADLSFNTTSTGLTTTAPATSVTTTGAIFNGTVYPNNLSTTVTFEYGTSTSYGNVVTASQSPVSGTNPVSVTAALGGLTPGTIYHYKVKAINTSGNTYGEDVTFTTLKLPDATTGSATSITPSGATLNGTVNANNSQTDVTFEYGPTTDYGSEITSTQSPVSGNTDTPVNAIITGFSAGTVIHFRIKAGSAAGTSWGTDKSFTTLSAPTAVIASATSVTGSSAMLNGTVNANSGSTVVSFEYGSTIAYGTEVTATQSPVSGNIVTPVSASVSGLTPGSTIHFRIKAVNAAGTSYSPDQSFTTPTLPIAVVSTATSITASSAILNGTVNANNSSTVVTFEYGSTTAYGTEITATQSPLTGNTVTSVSALVSGLSQGTTIHYRIKAVNAAGTAYSSDQSFITLVLPVAVTDPATSVTASSTILNGTVDANNSSAGVTFEYGQTTAYGTSVTATQSPVTGTTTTPVSASLASLAASTTYHYKVKAVSAAGSAEGSDVTFTTGAAVTVPVVTTTAITDITTTTATGGGNVTADGGALVTGRGVCWNTTINPDTTNSKSTDDSGIGLYPSSITGLTSGTTYHVRAYATNSAGTAYGSDVTFTTNGVPTVTTAVVSSTACASAKSGGNVTSSGGSTVTVKGVCWSTISNPTTSDSQTMDGSGLGLFTSSITGLSPNTTYYLRAFATNTYGTAYGNQISFTTTQQVTDFDGNVYNTITIGTQLWMQENLKTTHYRDGSPVPNVVTGSIWGSMLTDAYCWNNNDIDYKDPYGALYNFYAAVDNHVLCPTGWHVPTDAEWTTLQTFLGGSGSAGGKMKETGISHWNSPNTGATNESGFTGIPGGHRQGGVFISVGDHSFFWSSTQGDWYLSASSGSFGGSSSANVLSFGYSVRCLQGEGNVLPSVTTNAITDIKSATATSGGYISSNGGSALTTRGVCWSTTTNPKVTGAHTSDGTLTGSFTSSITGLTVGTTYYLRAYATNGVGTAYGEEISFIPVYAVGDSYQGGIIFNITGTYPNQHGLICALADQGAGTTWGCDGSVIAGADGTTVGTGNQNTTDIVNGCPTAGIAARICSDLNLNGYTDWYLPSLDELGLLVQKYRDTMSSDFGGAFYYWSSTEYSGNPATEALYYNFTSGVYVNASKTQTAHVRAIRTF